MFEFAWRFLTAGRAKVYRIRWSTFSRRAPGEPPEVLVRDFDSRLAAFCFGLKCMAQFTPLDELRLLLKHE